MPTFLARLIVNSERNILATLLISYNNFYRKGFTPPLIFNDEIETAPTPPDQKKFFCGQTLKVSKIQAI